MTRAKSARNSTWYCPQVRKAGVDTVHEKLPKDGYHETCKNLKKLYYVMFN